MFDHLIAVLAFAGVCAALYGIQWLAGDDGEGGCAARAPGCRGDCAGEIDACPNHAVEAD